jgi:molecular chaperone DnaJ
VTKSPYEVLGVAKNASQDEIKKAYRTLARRHHPDANAGDKDAEERFKEVQNAYDVLSDPEKRQRYDTFGSANGRGGPGAGFNWSAAEGLDFGDLGNLGDLFGGMFGGRMGGMRSEPRGQRGNDVEVQVNLSFEDALKGVETKIPVRLEVACHTCHGSGARPGTAPVVCPQCGGRGVIAESQGFFSLSQPCPRCRGNGSIIEEPCPTCRGAGRELRTKRYTVKIPAGVKDGSRIRLKGKGEAGWGGAPAGDLYVVTRVEPSKTYTRRGDDLIVEVPVAFADAALGTTVPVPTPDGDVKVKVPAGSEDGKMLRVKGKGAPRLKAGGRGDVLARLRIQVPKKPSKRERELLEELRKVGS